MPSAAQKSGPTADAVRLVTLLVAGVAATLAWEAFARLVAPLWIGGPLEPAGLVQAAFGIESRAIADAIHFGTGVVVYPLAYALIVRPLARALLPFLPWWIVGIGFGIGLWIFGLYVMAHLVAGFPAFLGFASIAWASLAGHVLYGMVVAGVFRGLRRGAA